MCEDSGQKDGDMPEKRLPPHSAYCCSNRRSKPAVQVKWMMPWELFLIHRQSMKNAFQLKLRMFGHKELPQVCMKIVVKKTVIC